MYSILVASMDLDEMIWDTITDKCEGSDSAGPFCHLLEQVVETDDGFERALLMAEYIDL